MWAVSTDLFSIPLGLRDTLFLFFLSFLKIREEISLLKVLPHNNYIPKKTPSGKGSRVAEEVYVISARE